MVEKKEGETKLEPIRFDNVKMIHKESGISLRGANIRPLIECLEYEDDEDMSVMAFPVKFIIQSADRYDGCLIDSVIDLKTLTRILSGEELEIKGGFDFSSEPFACTMQKIAKKYL